MNLGNDAGAKTMNSAQTPFPENGGGQESAEESPITLPDGLTKNFIIEWAKTRNEKFSKWAKDEFSRIENWHKMNENINIAGMNKGGTFIPLSNSIIETDTARRTALMFARPKMVEAIPLNPMQDNEDTQDIEDYVNQEIMLSVRTAEKGYDAFKGQAIEGTGIGKSYWEQVEAHCMKPVFSVDPESGLKVQTGEEPYLEMRGRWNWNPIAIQNMAWDARTASRIQDSAWVRERMFLTLNELTKKEEAKEIQDVALIEKQASEIKDNTPKDGEAERIRHLREQQLPVGDGDDGVYQVEEWHAELTWKNEAVLQTGKFRFWIVNEQTLVKFEDNPLDPKRNPYFSFRYSIRPRRLLGNGALAPIQELQIYANNLMGSSQELIKKAAANPTFYEKASGLDGRKAIVTEGALIPVLDANRIKYFPVDVGAISAVERKLAAVVSLVRETTASNEQALGVSGGSDTATEATILARSAGARFQMSVDLAAWEFFAQGLAQECYWMYRQFGADNQMVVRAPSGIDGRAKYITRAQLQKEFIFVPVTSQNEVAKNAEVKNYLALFDKLAQMQVQAPQMMVDKQGIPLTFDFVGALNDEIFPRLGIRNGKSYWTAKPQQPMGIPGNPNLPANPNPASMSAGGGLSNRTMPSAIAMGEAAPIEGQG